MVSDHQKWCVWGKWPWNQCCVSEITLAILSAQVLPKCTWMVYSLWTGHFSASVAHIVATKQQRKEHQTQEKGGWGGCSSCNLNIYSNVSFPRTTTCLCCTCNHNQASLLRFKSNQPNQQRQHVHANQRQSSQKSFLRHPWKRLLNCINSLWIKFNWIQMTKQACGSNVVNNSLPAWLQFAIKRTGRRRTGEMLRL